MLVQCYSSTPGYEEGETYYADAVKSGDGVRYKVNVLKRDPVNPTASVIGGKSFGEDEFKKSFKTVQHRNPEGGKSYGGFKTESKVRAAVDALFNTEAAQ